MFVLPYLECQWIQGDSKLALDVVNDISKHFRAILPHLHCIAEIRVHWVETKPFEIDNPSSTSLPDCLTMPPLFVFMWWNDFLKISRKYVGREVEGFSFRLNECQQYCARNYEKKCKFKINSVKQQKNATCDDIFTIK